MPNTLLNLGMTQRLLDADDGTGASAKFALPVAALAMTWQVTLDNTPATLALSLDISLDGINWTTIASATEASFTNDVYLSTIATVYAGKFIRVNVPSNPNSAEVTVDLLVVRAV